MGAWPTSVTDLFSAQEELGRADPTPWSPPLGSLLMAACFVCFRKGRSGSGAADEPAWAAAVLTRDRKMRADVALGGRAGWAYESGLMALREGDLLDAAVSALPERPDLLLVNATGRDHPRRAGLALQMGAVLDVPTVGVTDRLLVADGREPGTRRGDTEPFRIGDEHVGYWLRSRAGTRPIAVHAGWRTTPDVAMEVVIRSLRRARTPEPLRRARYVARMARAWAESGYS